MSAHRSLSPKLATRYRVLDCAGAGGSAEVFRARDDEQGCTVALKVERAPSTVVNQDVSAVRRALSQEAKYAALALSSRLPELVDVGWASFQDSTADVTGDPGADRRACVVFRWVEGQPVSEVCSKLSVAQRHALALRVARDAGEALLDLHDIGLAHGDLKPENLIVTPTGRIDVIDLGLAAPLHQTRVEGATLRYLARNDAEMGDARARDLLALGVLLTEIAIADVALARDPIDAARSTLWTLDHDVASSLRTICGALLSPSPAARPSAAWVTEMADAAIRLERRDTGQIHELATLQQDRRERDARRVRSTYLRLRRAELETATGLGEGVSPWLADAVAWVQRASAIVDGSVASKTHVLHRLGPDGIARWFTLLVGTSATSWPIARMHDVSEHDLSLALISLAQTRPPRAWTFAGVEHAVLQNVVQATVQHPSTEGTSWQDPVLTADVAAELAIAIARIPADPLAIEIIEQRSHVPLSLVLKAADALRLHGDFGRARSLVMREHVRDAKGAAALMAEILRRSGDRVLAKDRARMAMDLGADPEGRARAVLARMAIDDGKLEEADALSSDATTAALCEVRALIAITRGHEDRALAEVARAEALSSSTEEQARAAALLGYAVHASDPERAHTAFVAAVDYAVRAGAVIEEATYRTGEAATAVDLGDIGGAIATGKRAALLWEHLGRPAQAARALLASAAAYATAGMVHETVQIAHEAILRAREGGDVRAEAYALWAISDVIATSSHTSSASHTTDVENSTSAADQAASLLQHASDDDALRAAARQLQSGSTSINNTRIDDLDEVALRATGISVEARLDWWFARASRKLATADNAERSDRILSALASLASARAPIAARGRAFAAGYDLAVQRGQTEIAHRLLAALTDAAHELIRRASPELSEAVRSLPWITRVQATPEIGLGPEQARDLESLVCSLSERERLVPLLNRIVDALVLWTGVERGLLLLNAPNGRLRVRAARNLARSDLGEEQMSLSQTLAQRALEAREPVVAVDAAGELPSVHHSVHALKLRSVLAVPLIARGEALGVVYLDDRVRRGAFGSKELRWVGTIASLAALAIADARDQLLLRRAARRAERASAKLVHELARREAELDATSLELAKSRSARGTRYLYDQIIGESEPVRAMLRLVDRVTSAEIPVLIYGESGSGKELVARAIHANGPRASRPFVSENCGAIPEGLLESTLFGHVRGAFTGAERPRAGLFEVADHGTLFLDEIGEMSLQMQTRLLRILEDGMVRPVGSERSRKINVRVIAATHRDLESMVKAQTFREDLFYRLNIIAIRIPPLRERPGDIPLIVQHLIKKHGNSSIRVTRAAMDRLVGFPWPGNVRQLENEVRRAIVLCDGTIDKEHLSPDLIHSTVPTRVLGLNVRGRVDALETELVRDALERTHGNQTQAAKLLGLSRFGLQKMMKRLGIEN